jgi:ABC-type uncharacterized transport system substrate-binding protein
MMKTVISQYRAFAEAGALLAFGPNDSAMYRRAAYYVDRILKGANAGDLPVEQAIFARRRHQRC